LGVQILTGLVIATKFVFGGGPSCEGSILKVGTKRNLFWIFLGFGQGSQSQIPRIFWESRVGKSWDEVKQQCVFGVATQFSGGVDYCSCLALFYS